MRANYKMQRLFVTAELAAGAAVETSPDSITFVNAAHDYPQRVHYRRTAAGLDAEISLADGSKPTKWSYRRSGSPEPDQPTISSGLKK